MKELITLRQANEIVLAVLIAAPIVGLIWGAIAKRIVVGLAWGLGIGVGNLVLWRLYNAITDRLGLDSVANLLTNLGLFVVVGLVGGTVAALITNRGARPDGEAGDAAIGRGAGDGRSD